MSILRVHLPPPLQYVPERVHSSRYAMERTSSFIKVWFWPRQGDVPSDVVNSAKTVDTDAWGTPVAFFPNTQCNLEQFFAAHNIIINLTLCE